MSKGETKIVRCRQLLRLSFLALAMLLIPAASALAATASKSSIVHTNHLPFSVHVQQLSPSIKSDYFTVQAKLGASENVGRILIENRSFKTIYVGTKVVNGETAADLGATYDLRSGIVPTGATTWIKVPNTLVRVPPRTVASVPVTIDVPLNAKVSDYLSGVYLVSDTAQGKPILYGGTAKTAVSIARILSYTIGVEVKVGTKRDPRLKLHSITLKQMPSGAAFFLNTSSPGNMLLLDVHGWAKIKNETTGKYVVNYHSPTNAFVPATSISYMLQSKDSSPAAGTKFLASACWIYDVDRRTCIFDKLLTYSPADQQVQVKEPSTTGKTTRIIHQSGFSTTDWIIVGLLWLLLLLPLLFFLLRRRRAYLGVELDPVSPTSLVQIEALTEEGPALLAGLTVGDVITMFDGKPVFSGEELATFIHNLRNGDRTTLTYHREDESATIPVTLGRKHRGESGI